MKRFVLLGMVLGTAACDGSNTTPTVDAGVVDAGVADAGVADAGVADAEVADAGVADAGVADAGLVDAGLVDAGLVDAGAVDAATADVPATDAPTTAGFSVTFSVLEVGILPSTANATMPLSQGIQIGTIFSGPGAVAPVFDSSPGSPLGCKVFVYDSPASLATLAGANEGTIRVTVDNPGSMPDPLFPTCFHSGSAGYLCPDLASSQAPGATTTSISVTENVVITTTAPGTTPGATALLTVSATSSATFDSDDVGRYIRFAGTSNPGAVPLDAATSAFPILARITDRSVLIAMPLPAATTVPITAGTFTTLAGFGPTPGLADPGMLADDATVTATFVGNASAGGNHFGNFGISWTGANVGNDFDLDATNANLLRNIPSDGSEFTVTGGTGSTAGGVFLNLDTTDTSVAGLSASDFPPPTARRVSVRCARLGAASITVPAAVSAYLTPAMSGRTRVRATFGRATLGIPTPPPTGSVTAVAGHAVIGFSTGII
jgi:hypothetical protein